MFVTTQKWAFKPIHWYNNCNGYACMLLLLLLLMLYSMYTDLQSTLVVTAIIHTKFKCSYMLRAC